MIRPASFAIRRPGRVRQARASRCRTGPVCFVSFNDYGRSKKGTQNGPRSWRAVERYRDPPRGVKSGGVPPRHAAHAAFGTSADPVVACRSGDEARRAIVAAPGRSLPPAHTRDATRATRRARRIERDIVATLRARFARLGARRDRFSIVFGTSERIDSDRSSWYEMRRNDCDENSLALTSHPTGRLRRFHSSAGPRLGPPLTRRLEECRCPTTRRRAPPISRPILNATAKGGEGHSEEEEGRQEEREEESVIVY